MTLEGNGNREVAEMAARVEAYKNELAEYAKAHGLHGLEGRVQRGLDPAAMQGLKKTSDKLAKVAESFGADPDEVAKLTDELHVGAIWSHADELEKGEDPAIKTWMVSAGAMAKGPESDLSPKRTPCGLCRREEVNSKTSICDIIKA